MFLHSLFGGAHRGGEHSALLTVAWSPDILRLQFGLKMRKHLFPQLFHLIDGRHGSK
jgi:hypothetical protein